MFLNFKRTLMSEADSGSGNGAAVPQTSAEPADVPQAQGDTVTLSKSDLAALIAEETTKAVSAVKDSIYAEARRTFAGSKKDSKPKAAEEQTQAAAPDPTRLRALDRALAKGGFAERLNETQYKRIERQFLEESPDDASHWVSDYFDGFGVAKAQPAQNQAAQPATKPSSEHPISNRGAPPPAQVPLEELDLFTATESDRAAFIKAKGMRAYVTLLNKQAKGRPVRFT